MGTDNGKTSTRDLILEGLKTEHEATVDRLAKMAGVSPMTVRHHLNALQADGLLHSHSVRRKVGRPYHVYTLSEAGHELFPTRYLRLSNRLLEEIKRQFSADAAVQLMQGVVEQIIDDRRDEFETLATFEDRLAFLVSLLDDEGFMARWEKGDDNTYQITEHSCPYLSVGSRHDEICSFDMTLMVSVLQTDVQKESCMLQGDRCCQFSVVAPLPSIDLAAPERADNPPRA